MRFVFSLGLICFLASFLTANSNGRQRSNAKQDFVRFCQENHNVWFSQMQSGVYNFRWIDFQPSSPGTVRGVAIELKFGEDCAVLTEQFLALPSNAVAEFQKGNFTFPDQVETERTLFNKKYIAKIKKNQGKWVLVDVQILEKSTGWLDEILGIDLFSPIVFPQVNKRYEDFALQESTKIKGFGRGDYNGHSGMVLELETPEGTNGLDAQKNGSVMVVFDSQTGLATYFEASMKAPKVANSLGLNGDTLISISEMDYVNSNNIPILKQVIHRSNLSPNVTQILFDPPIRKFEDFRNESRLAYYGLPEPPGLYDFNRRMIWIGVAIFCLLMFFALIRLASRKMANSSG